MVSMQRIITYINDFTLSPRQNGRLVEDGIVKVFSEEKILCFDPVFTDVCFERSHCKKKKIQRWIIYFLEPATSHWGRVTHIWVSKLNIIGSDNGLSPGRRQAIIWTNAGILSIPTMETKFNEILSAIHAFSFNKTHFKCPLWNGGRFVTASMC